MFDELLRDVGAFVIFLIAGNYYLRWQDYRKERDFIKGQMQRLRERKAAHPEEAAEIDARLHELLDSYPLPPRVLQSGK